MKRKILVIGGNKFFGRRLVHQLIANEDDVTVLNRGRSGDDFGDRVQRIQCDRTDGKALFMQVKDKTWDVVYDQVCYEAHEARMACEIFEGFVQKYIFTSSQSVYRTSQSADKTGANLKEQAFNPTTHEFTVVKTKEEDYSEAKRQCEAVFFKSRMPVCAVRFPIVMGPDDYTDRLKFHVSKIKRGKPIHFPQVQARMSFIHAADAAAGLFLLGNSLFTGPINMASEKPIEIGELIQEIESVTSMKAVISDDGEASPYGIRKDMFINVEQALSLGFKPQPIKDWLRPLIQEVDSVHRP